MRQFGGIERVLGFSFEAVRKAVDPKKAPDCILGFEIKWNGVIFPYTLIVEKGIGTIHDRSPYDAPLVLIVSVPNLARLLIGEIDWVDCFMDGRVKSRGDLAYLENLQNMFVKRADRA